MTETIAHSKPWITSADEAAVQKALASGQVARGRTVEEFESRLKALLGAHAAVAVASGTSALVLSLNVLGVGPGHEVIVPSYVCVNVMNAVLAAGATPVFCDTGSTWTITADSVAPYVTPRTRAVVAVHTFGIQAPVAEIERRFSNPVIEDCCHALGRAPDGSLPGGTGTCAFFSFHATKCLSTGEGGLLTLRSTALAEIAMKLVRNKAAVPPLSDLAAALGLAQLDRYPQFLSRRAAIAARYLRELRPELVETLRPVAQTSTHYRFPVTVRRGVDAAMETLARRGIQARRGVDAMLHRIKGGNDASYPRTVEAFTTTLSIPIYPAMSDADISRVIDGVNSLP